MTIKLKKNILRLMSLILFFGGTSSYASPWASPNDERLRSDVELLAKFGLVSGPINSWPISWKQITSSLYKAEEQNIPSYVSRALMRVNGKIPSEFNVKAKVYYSNKPKFFRGYEKTGRSDFLAESILEYNLDHTSIHLNAGYDNNGEINFDDSYISQDLGNWSIYAGRVDRWWGPGKESSTLLSTNARPMPTIGIRRIEAVPFNSKWLNWIGAWQGEFFVSKMEKNRFVPSPVFVGMRLNFEPIKNFEVGLARTLMLCGEGRSCNFKSWSNGLIAIGDLDNATSSEGFIEQPGNQLAMINLSYSLSLKENMNVKIYAEGTAEDVIVFLPYTYTRLLGASFYGPMGDGGDQYRITAEASDSTGSLAWFYGQHRKRVMYRHSIYKTGYRYHDKVIGSNIDSDSLYFSLKASLLKSNGWEYSLKYQNILINMDSSYVNQLSPQRERINSLGMNIIAQTNWGEFQLDGNLMDNNINTPLEDKVNFIFDLKWSIGF